MPDARKIAETIGYIDSYQERSNTLISEMTNISYPNNLRVEIMLLGSMDAALPELEKVTFWGNGDGFENRIMQAMIAAGAVEAQRIITELLLEIERA